MTATHIALLAAHVALSGVKVDAHIDRNTARVGEQLNLTVEVTGSDRGEPRLPDLPGFDVYSRGTSTKVSVVNGRASTSMTFSYVLIPKHAGTFRVGPVTMSAGGQTSTSKPFRIMVLPASAEAPQEQSRDVFITVEVSDNQPFVGEQVIYTLRLYRHARVRLANARLDGLNFDGFLMENLGEQRDFKTTYKGQQYEVTELRRALFPQEAGSFDLVQAKIAADIVIPTKRRGRNPFDNFGSPFDDFFGRGRTESRVIVSRKLSLNVRALPSPPTGFSGLVGNFSVKSSLSKKKLATGESTTLTVTVTGTGNVHAIGEPKIPEDSDFHQVFKSYDDRPTSTKSTSGKAVTGSKTFRKSLVPTKSGTHEIPSIPLIYFDANTESYRTARSEAFKLEIAPSENDEELKLTEFRLPTSGKVAVKVLGDDILPAYTKMDALQEPWFKRLPQIPWAGLLLTPPLLYMGVLLRTRRRDLDPKSKRKRTAGKRARTALASASAEDAAQVASGAVREFIGDMIGREGKALTAAEAAEVLEERGVGERTTAATKAFLKQCEAAKYGAATMSDGLPKEASALLDELEKTLK